MTKDVLAAGSTRWAQGGIAAALGDGDSAEEHFHDTIVAGVGLCDEAAVRVLVREGPAAVRELAQMGARFDRGADGRMSLTREGGHHRDRIAHAGGDATGAEIERALVARVLDATDVDVIEHALVLDLLLTADGARRRADPARDGRGTARRRRARCAPGPTCWPPAASARCTRRRRTRACRPVTASPRRCAPARSCATSSSCSSIPTVAWLGPRSRGQQPLV